MKPMQPADTRDYAVTVSVRITRKAGKINRVESVAELSMPADDLKEALKKAKPFLRPFAKAMAAHASSRWVDGGYLENGHCSFMDGGFSGACCCLRHGHEGAHQTDASPPAVATEGKP